MLPRVGLNNTEKLVMQSKRAVLLIIAALLAALVCWTSGSLLIAPARATLPTIPVGAEPVAFGSNSGATVRGWYFANTNATTSIVLMHGVRGNRADLTERALFFKGLGFNVLTFDFQAHGESSGEHITFGKLESLDAIAAVRYAHSLLPNQPVIALGVSLGGAASLLAGAQLDVDALIVESVYSDIEQAIENRLNKRIPHSGFLAPLLLWQLSPRLGIEATELSPLAGAAQINFPTLVLSGSEDRHTLLWETRAIHQAIPAAKNLHIFNGASHQNLHRFDPLAYRTVVINFICQTVELPICQG